MSIAYDVSKVSETTVAQHWDECFGVCLALTILGVPTLTFKTIPEVKARAEAFAVAQGGPLFVGDAAALDELLLRWEGLTVTNVRRTTDSAFIADMAARAKQRIRAALHSASRGVR